jgi:hypothetical protein
VKRHDLDPVSLVFGLLFLGAGLWVAVGEFSLANLDNDWVWPALAITAGLILVLPAAVRLRSERSREREGDQPS